MDYSKITESQAAAMLKDWHKSGNSLTYLYKTITSASGDEIQLLIPSYKDNQWHQIGKAYSSHSEALAAFGALIDEIRKVKG
jgi:hypothetical protein